MGPCFMISLTKSSSREARNVSVGLNISGITDSSIRAM